MAAVQVVMTAAEMGVAAMGVEAAEVAAMEGAAMVVVGTVEVVGALGQEMAQQAGSTVVEATEQVVQAEAAMVVVDQAA